MIIFLFQNINLMHYNQAAHQIDLMNWFMGPINEIQGYWDNFNHPYIEVEDSAVAIVKFKNGGLGSVLVSNSQNPASTPRFMSMEQAALPQAFKPMEAPCLLPA